MNDTGTAYVHGQWRYFVDKREDNGRFTAFMSSSDPIMNGAKTEVTGIGDWDTFEQAQNALDGFALKRKYAAECSNPDAEPEMEQQSFGSLPEGNSNSVSSANDTTEVEQTEEMNELAGRDDMGEMPDTDSNSSDSDNENPHSDNDSENSENDPEGSGDTEEKAEPLPDGPTLSLRLPAFNSVFDDADAKLRDLSRAMKTKLIESGELSIKIVINNYGSVLKPDPKKCKVECVPKPAKVSTQIRFPSDLEITVEQDGRVIIPEDREHQINFDEVQPGQRKYPPDGGTVTVDGQTGLAEHYEGDGEDKPDGGDTPPEGSEESTHGIPKDDSDLEGDPSAHEDQPPYSDGENLGQGDSGE